MKNLLILGAGRSSYSLIKYLLEKSDAHDLKLKIADRNIDHVQDWLSGSERAEAVKFELQENERLSDLVKNANLVISLLPARFHEQVARECIRYKKDMLTASYVSDELQKMEKEINEAGIMILMECGLDPGIDHMSAMRVMDKIRNEGGKLTHFETFTGGLLAPESELHNPWRYKFTWNPRNVVLAGQGNVKFIQERAYKYIPYYRLFRRTEIIEIPGYGFFEGYANRDSLKYLDVYGLRNIRTLYRGTLRRPGFCKAWDVFIQLGATDDSYPLENVSELTHRQFLNSFLFYNPNDSVELKLAHYLNLDLDSEIMFKLKWLGMFDDEPVGLNEGTPAQILEHILKKKWSMESSDKDMIVMYHKFIYQQGNQSKEIDSHTVVQGENREQTAMAKTVGLPLGIAAMHVLKQKIHQRGIHVPTSPEIYNPILDELEAQGVRFIEQFKD